MKNTKRLKRRSEQEKDNEKIKSRNKEKKWEWTFKILVVSTCFHWLKAKLHVQLRQSALQTIWVVREEKKTCGWYCVIQALPLAGP